MRATRAGRNQVEPLGRRRRLAAQLDREEVHAWIEADAELAALTLDSGGEAVGERRRGELGLYAELLRHRRDEAYAPRPTATTPSKPQVVSPAQWGAAPTRVALPARGPLDHLVLHHTAFPMSRIGGSSFETEAAHMREIQRWHLERGDIIFPKSMHRERMEENFALFDFELTDEDVATIAALDRGETGRTGPNPNTFDMIR